MDVVVPADCDCRALYAKSLEIYFWRALYVACSSQWRSNLGNFPFLARLGGRNALNRSNLVPSTLSVSQRE